MYIGTQPYSGIRARHTYTATANQTSFSGAGAENVTLTYADELYIDVYHNGVDAWKATIKAVKDKYPKE